MKSSAYKWAYLLIALVIGACSSSGEDFSSPVAADIRFAIGIAPMTRVGTDFVFASKWEEGDEIGIFASKTGEALSASANHIHNVRLVYSEGNWHCDSALIWQEDMHGLDFYAYYPYDDNGGFPEALNPLQLRQTVAQNQNEEIGNRSAYSASDLLVASASVEKGDVVVLSFSHVLSLLQLEVLPNGNSEAVMEQLTVKLHAVYPDYELNLEDKGVVRLLDEYLREDISMLCCGKNSSGNWIYRALIPPQVLTIASCLFRIERNGVLIAETEELMEYVWLYTGTAECFQFELPELK